MVAWESNKVFCQWSVLGVAPGIAENNIGMIHFSAVGALLSKLRPHVYSSVHDQLPPPFGEISNSLRASNLAWLPPTVHSNYSEAVCLAARTSAIRDRPSSIMSWSLLNIIRFPPVRYCQISSAIAETALYSCFGGGIGKRGSVY